MSQHDFDIANQTASAARADINSALKALGSNSSGTTEPATTYANQWFYNTATDTLLLRNEANDDWITVGTFNQTTGVFTPAGLTNLTSVQAEDELSTVFGMVSGEILSGIGGQSPTLQVFTASGTWTRPAGCKTIKITITGAGAGGNDTDDGGGSGATGITYRDVTALSSATVTIGAGGAGSSNGSSNAGGNSTWVGGGTITAAGATTTSTGAVCTGADLNLGGTGFQNITGNDGAASFWGGGGSTGNTGAAAIAYGSGGGADSGGSGTGGAGADGVCVVEEFY